MQIFTLTIYDIELLNETMCNVIKVNMINFLNVSYEKLKVKKPKILLLETYPHGSLNFVW